MINVTILNLAYFKKAFYIVKILVFSLLVILRWINFWFCENFFHQFEDIKKRRHEENKWEEQWYPCKGTTKNKSNKLSIPCFAEAGIYLKYEIQVKESES